MVQGGGEAIICIKTHSIGEELVEECNAHDPFAVAVVRAGVIVGHIPRRISAICTVFLRRSGTSILMVLDATLLAFHREV